MLTTIGAAELTEWMAFDRMEPFGDARADLRAGIVASAIVNHSFSPPKEPATPASFMPFHPRHEPDPVLLDDPAAQSQLIHQALFGALFERGT